MLPYYYYHYFVMFEEYQKITSMRSRKGQSTGKIKQLRMLASRWFLAEQEAEAKGIAVKDIQLCLSSYHYTFCSVWFIIRSIFVLLSFFLVICIILSSPFSVLLCDPFCFIFWGQWLPIAPRLCCQRARENHRGSRVHMGDHGRQAWRQHQSDQEGLKQQIKRQIIQQ